MPTKKINQEFFNNEPAPKRWTNSPEQFVYEKNKILFIQNGLDAPLELTVNRTRSVEDIDKIIKWVNENNLDGGWSKWEKILGHTFIELMKLPTETHKELYQKYKESMQLKLVNALKILKTIKKEIERLSKIMDANITPCLIGISEQIKTYPDYIEKYTVKYQDYLNDLSHTGSYVLMKPHLNRLIKELDIGRQPVKEIYSLFKIFDVNDFNKMTDEKSLKEQVRNLINRTTKPKH